MPTLYVEQYSYLSEDWILESTILTLFWVLDSVPDSKSQVDSIWLGMITRGRTPRCLIPTHWTNVLGEKIYFRLIFVCIRALLILLP